MVSRGTFFGRKRPTNVADVQRDLQTLQKDLKQVRGDLTEVMQTIVQLGSDRKEQIQRQLRDTRWGVQPVSAVYGSARRRAGGMALSAVQTVGSRALGVLGTLVAVVLGVSLALAVKKLWWDQR